MVVVLLSTTVVLPSTHIPKVTSTSANDNKLKSSIYTYILDLFAQSKTFTKHR